MDRDTFQSDTLARAIRVLRVPRHKRRNRIMSGRYITRVPCIRFATRVACFAFVTLVGLLTTPSSAYAQFAINIGGLQADQGRAIAADDNGNTYVTGFFNATVDFDPGIGVVERTATTENVFIASYDMSGAFRYVVTFQGEGYGIAVDGNGNVFATGRFSGMIDVDPGPGEEILNSTDGRVFVVSYDPDGELRFGFAVGGNGPTIEWGSAITTDSAGNIYVTGIYSDADDFDPDGDNDPLPFNGISDVFVASYSNTGTYRYAFGFGGTSSDHSYGITTDDAGNTYVTGGYRGMVDFDPRASETVLTSNGSLDLYVASYAGAGELRYVIGAGGAFDDVGNGIAIDADGNSFVTGALRDSADFDPGIGELWLKSEGNEDMFLASYSSAGALRFAFRIGSPNPAQGTGVATDALGRVYITGFYRQETDFDPGDGVEMLPDGLNTFVASYYNDGRFRYAYNFPDTNTDSSDEGAGIAVDASGRTYVVGTFGGPNDFAPGPDVVEVSAVGSSDVFVTTFSASTTNVSPDDLKPSSLAVSAPWPNPSNGVAQFELVVGETQQIRAELFDVLGRSVAVVADRRFVAGQPSTISVPTSELPGGLYLIRVTGRNTMRMVQLVVAR